MEERMYIVFSDNHVEEEISYELFQISFVVYLWYFQNNGRVSKFLIIKVG